MGLVRITPNVLVIGDGHRRLWRGTGAANSTIVTADVDSLIVDPGVPVFQGRILEHSHRSGLLDTSRIRMVLLTHQHWDHTQQTYWLAKSPDLTVCAHSAEVAPLQDVALLSRNYYKGYRFRNRDFQNFMMPYPQWVFETILRSIWGTIRPIKVTDPIDQGSAIAFGTPIEVIGNYCHTRGALSFYFPEHHLVVLGDLIDLHYGKGIDVNSPLSEWSRGVEAIADLLKRDIRIMVPGHGPVIIGADHCQEVLKQRLDQARWMRDRTCQLLLGRPYSFKDILFVICPEGRHWFRYDFMKHVMFCLLADIDRETPLIFDEQDRMTLE